MASLLDTIKGLFKTPPPDVNLASLSKTGSCWNPTVLASPPPVLVPADAIMAPSNAQSFASCLKLSDGLTNTSLSYASGNPIGQGSEGVLDVCNGVSNVTVSAVYGTGGTHGERVASFKGTTNVKVIGSRNCNGTWCTWLVGRYYNEGKAVDVGLDLSGVPGGGTVVLARGLFRYLFGNRNKLNLGTCKVAWVKSIGEWALCHIKTLVNPPKASS